MLAHYLKTIVRLKKVREGALPLYGIALVFFKLKQYVLANRFLIPAPLPALGMAPQLLGLSKPEVHFFLK